MKRVSFKVAKAIKEAEYPQEKTWFYSPDGRIGEVIPDNEDIAAPTYLEVWLWLWREKKIAIGCPYENTYNYWFTNISAENNESTILWKYSSGESNDPEDPIIAAIEYLVDNNLIK